MDLSIPIPQLDLEHNKIIDRLPMFLVVGLLILMLIPIPAEIKSPILIGGLVIVLPLTFPIDAYAYVAVAKNNVIKARIMPWGIEKEFHIKKAIGRINSTYNPTIGTYTSPFELAFPTSIPELKIPEFSEIEVEHKLHWETRNSLTKAYVHWQGIETVCSNVILCELWYTGERPPKVGDVNDFLGFVPHFRLARGSNDFWLLKGQPIDERLMREATI